MYQSKQTIKDRKEIIAIIKAKMIKNKEVDARAETASLSIETGYPKEFIQEIFATLEEAGFLLVGHNGIAHLTGAE